MKGITKVGKGRVEEAVGVLIGNERLTAKGQSDQTVGHAKQSAERSLRRAKKSARSLADKLVTDIDQVTNGQK